LGAGPAGQRDLLPRRDTPTPPSCRGSSTSSSWASSKPTTRWTACPT
jgi:hypothetical protein